MKLGKIMALRGKLRFNEHIFYTVIFELEAIVNYFKEKKKSYVKSSGI